MEIIKARVMNRIGSEAEWLQFDPIILEGEMAFTDRSGIISIRVGDGLKKYSQLTDNVSVTADGAYKGSADLTTVPPTPTTPVYYIATQAGTYTNFGGVVIPENKIAVIQWNGSVWKVTLLGIDLSKLATKEETKVSVAAVQKSQNNLYAFAWLDKFDRMAAYIDKAGFFKAFKWISNSIPGAALQTFNGSEKINAGTINYEQLSETARRGMALITNIPGYKMVAVDPNNRYAWAIADDGTMFIPKIKLPLNKLKGESIQDGTISIDKLDANAKTGIAQILNVPGYKFVIVDANNRYAFSMRNDGTVHIPKLKGYSPTFSDGSISYLKLDNFLRTLKPLFGKKMLAVGDSVTIANNYQQTVADITGLTITTHALGGIGLVQMIDGNGSTMPALTAAQLADKDIVTIFGTLNDRGSLVGSKTDMYPTQTTIYGRLNYVINKIYTLASSVGRKDIRIVFIAPHKVGKYSYIDADGGQEFPAGSGQTLEDIVNAIINRAGFYGLPVIDLYRKSGINNYNWDIFTMNNGPGAGPYPSNNDNVHPNAAGGVLIGKVIGNFLNNL